MNENYIQRVASAIPRSGELSRHSDSRFGAEWFYMQAAPRACFTTGLLDALKSGFAEIAQRSDDEVNYVVIASSVPGTYNLGGDLALFQQYIHDRNREGLLEYARKCVDLIYTMTAGVRRGVCGVMLVQGDALGGGMEAALSGDVLIAERNVRMGLPEIMFNLFPGMGAYSLLSRKVGPKLAERMILSGQLYTAEELHEMGIVDRLAEPGEGERAVREFMEEDARRANGARALREAKRLSNPVTYQELYAITEVWVDAALRLTDRDLRMMERLVKRQTKRSDPVVKSA